VEWVETTGRTIEDAKEAALDQLGVDESDAEFEVVEEPRAGLFGRLRSEARVRARVRPTAPRAKDDRRDRRRRGRANGESRDAAAQPGSEALVAGAGKESKESASGAAQRNAAAEAARANIAPGGGSDTGRTASGSTNGEAPGESVDIPATVSNRPASAGSGAQNESGDSIGTGRPDRHGVAASSEQPVEDKRRSGDQDQKGGDMEVPLDEQGQIAHDFLTRLVTEFGLQAAVNIVRPDDDTVDLQLEGSDLGLLIGPRGATLLAIQDLTRTVVHHRTGAGNGRIHVDVGGYRQKRTEALVRFAQQVAATVQSSGTRSVLEPMTAADRKVVHDAITPIDGVSTVSEGEEPQRRVVVVPATS
jgi:spoIIIJ-associated protein